MPKLLSEFIVEWGLNDKHPSDKYRASRFWQRVDELLNPPTPAQIQAQENQKLLTNNFDGPIEGFKL